MAKRCRTKTGQFKKCPKTKKAAGRKASHAGHGTKRCRGPQGKFVPCGPSSASVPSHVALEQEWEEAWAKGGFGAPKAAEVPSHVQLEQEWGDAWEAYGRQSMSLAEAAKSAEAAKAAAKAARAAAKEARINSPVGRGRPIGNIQRKPGCFYYVDEKGIIREKNAYQQKCP